MGKIRLHDLAEKMGVPEQDLLFKLKSIGVRVEGEDALIDTEIIQAILQGKKLPQPQREVILRDASAAKTAPQKAGQMPKRLLSSIRCSSISFYLAVLNTETVEGA